MLRVFFVMWLILLSTFSVEANTINHKDSHRIVFIHLGENLPDYLHVSLAQARLFNPDTEVVLIANQVALDSQKQSLDNYTVIAAEKIQKTAEHLKFIRISKHDRKFRNGFWFFATERLFYLDDLISQFDLENTFHLESDNMLYVNLTDLLPVFINNYRGIGVPFESDERGIASFVYVRDKRSIHALATHLLELSHLGENEMVMISTYKEKFGQEYMDHLPTLMDDYGKDYELVSLDGRKTHIDGSNYSKCLNQFNSLFDACSYGQYLGGEDPRNGSAGPGYLNSTSVFNCSFMTYEWKEDCKKRMVPYVVYKDKKYRLNNLHIHSKNLNSFASVVFNFTQR